jgi:hypothetical protein
MEQQQRVEFNIAEAKRAQADRGVGGAVEAGAQRAPRPLRLCCSRYWIVTVTGIE